MGDYEWAIVLLLVLGIAAVEWVRIRRELRRDERDQLRGMRNGSSARTQPEEKRSSERLS